MPIKVLIGRMCQKMYFYNIFNQQLEKYGLKMTVQITTLTKTMIIRRYVLYKFN